MQGDRLAEMEIFMCRYWHGGPPQGNCDNGLYQGSSTPRPRLLSTATLSTLAHTLATSMLQEEHIFL